MASFSWPIRSGKKWRKTSKVSAISQENLAQQNISIDEIPYVLQYNKRDLKNVAPINYLEFLLNNRKKRVQSFEVISSTGQNVFASLNAVSQMLLHKFSKQGDAAARRRRLAGRRASRTRSLRRRSPLPPRMNCIPALTIENVASSTASSLIS